MRKFLAVFLSVLLGAQICFGIQVGAEDAPEPDVENLNTEDAVSENSNPVSAGQEIENQRAVCDSDGSVYGNDTSMKRMRIQPDHQRVLQRS